MTPRLVPAAAKARISASQLREHPPAPRGVRGAAQPTYTSDLQECADDLAGAFTLPDYLEQQWVRTDLVECRRMDRQRERERLHPPAASDGKRAELQTALQVLQVLEEPAEALAPVARAREADEHERPAPPRAAAPRHYDSSSDDEDDGASSA